MTVLIVVGALLLATGGGALVTPLVLRLATRRSAAESAKADSRGRDGGGEGAVGEGADGVVPDGADVAVQHLRGGLVIGLLERLAVTGTILLGFPEGIAVVVAVKGLGRFPELRHVAAGNEPERAAVSERFIIGTLASLVWAVGIAALGVWLLAL